MKRRNPLTWLTLVMGAVGVWMLLQHPLMSRVVTVAGKVQAQSATVDILSPYTAHVDQRWVQNGQPVEAGALLFELESEWQQASVDQARQERLQAAGQIWLYGSLLKEQVQPWPSRLDPPPAPDPTQWHVQFLAQQNAVNEKKLHFSRQISQQQDALNAWQQQHTSLAHAHRHLESQHQQSLALWQEGFLSTHMLSKSEESLARSHAELLGLMAQVRQAQQRIDVLVQDQSSWWAQQQAQWQAQQQQHQHEFQLLVRQEVQSQHELQQRRIRSPVSGVVQDVTRAEPKALVQAAELLARVVPTPSHWWVEAQLAEHDRAHVTLGQIARIKLQAYDFSEFGELAGRVVWLSPDTQASSENQAPTYRVHIEIDPTSNLRIQPMVGMLSQVDVVVGHRSAATWLFGPLIRLWQDSLREP